METRDIPGLLRDHAFFRGLDDKTIDFIAGCGSIVHVDADQFIFREGEPADYFYVIRSGRVALEVHGPEQGSLVLDVIGEGDIAGASWLFPPYRWELDARAVEKMGAVRLDAACLRAKCEEDQRLGFELMKRLAEIMRSRMQSARMRLLDLYGHAGGG